MRTEKKERGQNCHVDDDDDGGGGGGATVAADDENDGNIQQKLISLRTVLPLTSTMEFNPMQVHVRNVVDEVAQWESFIFKYLSFILSLSFHECSILLLVYSYQKDKRAEPGCLQTKQFSFGYRGALDIKVL